MIVAALRVILDDEYHRVAPKHAFADGLNDAAEGEIVVRNLVSNAVKYSPAGAPIAITIARRDGHALVAVADRGIGIDKDDQRNLFTRFGRIETSATAHTSGAGLGLWLSREIARMHDGDLTVESEPGKGSTFTLEIPLNSD